MLANIVHITLSVLIASRAYAEVSRCSSRLLTAWLWRWPLDIRNRTMNRTIILHLCFEHHIHVFLGTYFHATIVLFQASREQAIVSSSEPTEANHSKYTLFLALLKRSHEASHTSSTINPVATTSPLFSPLSALRFR